MIDVICEASVSQLSDFSTLAYVRYSITLLQRTNVTPYRKCPFKNQRFHPKDMSCNTPVYYRIEAATFHFEQIRRLEIQSVSWCDGLAKQTSSKEIFMTACVHRLLGDTEVCVCVCVSNLTSITA